MRACIELSRAKTEMHSIGTVELNICVGACIFCLLSIKMCAIRSSSDAHVIVTILFVPEAFFATLHSQQKTSPLINT